MEQKQQKKCDSVIDILLIEDEESDIIITLKAFEKYKETVRISVVSSAEQALDYLYQKGDYQNQEYPQHPHIILLDINMPKITGFELLRTIKNDHQLKTIPVVMLTSSRSEQDVYKSYLLQASGYISKPVNYKEFEKVVDSFYAYWHSISKLPKADIGVGEQSKQPEILVIDDSEQDLKALCMVLKKEGFTNLHTATTGEDGLKHVWSEQPDIVILDTVLPGRDGFDICSEIKKIIHCSPKVILVTGIIDAIDSMKAKESRADHYLVKTANFKLIVDAIKD